MNAPVQMLWPKGTFFVYSSQRTVKHFWRQRVYSLVGSKSGQFQEKGMQRLLWLSMIVAALSIGAWSQATTQTPGTSNPPSAPGDSSKKASSASKSGKHHHHKHHHKKHV